MTEFCPDGFEPISKAIFRAAQHWFSEQFAQTEAPGADDAEPGDPIEQARRAFSAPAIPDWLPDVVGQTADRFRKLLHQNKLRAYYFDSEEGQSIPPAFWATNEADGILEEGLFWPFGRPSRWTDLSRPSFRLFLRQSELHNVLQAKAGKKSFPDSRISELSNFMREFESLPRKEQFQRVRDKFPQLTITERQLREAARMAPRLPGRKSRRKS